MRLIPREEKFFHFFVDQANLILQAAKLLNQAARQGNSALPHAAVEIERLERRGDEIIHDLFTRLNQTFITPLDPEDIHTLGSRMDDVLDSIEESAHRIVSYKLDRIPAAMLEMCGVVESCAAALQKAMEALRDDQALLDHCIEINRLEDSADQLLRRSVSELFQTEKNPIDLIKLKEIYEFLELTTDCCEDVADSLQNVVVKNS